MQISLSPSLAGSATGGDPGEQSSIDHFGFTVQLGGVHEVILHGAFAEQHPLLPNQRAPTAMAKLLSAGMHMGACAPLDPQPTARLLFSMAHCAADAI
jgi:hypothetical protein